VLRTIIISPDVEVGAHLGQALMRFGGEVQVCRILDNYPRATDLIRTLRAHAPEIVFLSFENLPLALETVKFLEAQNSGVQIVAIHRVMDASLLRETMRAGIREFLTDPFEEQTLVEALRNLQALLQKKPPTYATANQVLTFLPSKAGVGATTLALNVSAALAKGREQAVALTDLDLNSGMLRFLLKLTNEFSVVEAVENAAEMDEHMWPQLVTQRYGMDVLHAGRVNPNLRVDPAQIQNLLQFMRRNYQALVFDTSGNLERYSLEAMQESNRIFMVCTPEIPSLHLAREKMGFLKSLGLDTKVGILLNRVQKKAIFTPQQVEELVGAQVLFSFTNDYFAVNRATTAGKCLDADSVIGKQCAEFAATLEDRKPAPAPAPRRRFLEYFSVSSQPQMASRD
jgi:Flp pilus assembly CpaE family ATPase